MRFEDEIRTPEAVGLPGVKRAPAKLRRSMEQAIEELVGDQLDESLLRDEESEALRDLAERKHAAGEDVVETSEAADAAADDEEDAGVIDIMEVLKRRMQRAGEPSRSAPRSRTKGESADGLESSTKKELYERAKALDLEGRSHMSKEELMEAIRAAS
jgi:DNA end-binding protein Ku